MPGLREVAIALPAPSAEWLPQTRDDYASYAESEVARLLRDEDIPAVRQLFDVRDRMAHLLADPDFDARTYVSLDRVVARLTTDLGIGPYNRVRLGLQHAEGRIKAAAARKADPFGDLDEE